jgi:cytochrome c oxidase assembly protein subunit 15
VAAATERRSVAGRLDRWWPVATWANLVAQVGIVVTGGVVRVSRSGLGCPTWPRCVPGSLTPVATQAEGFHKYIEFGNRLLTSVVSVTALAVLVVAVLAVSATGAPRRWIWWGSIPPLLVLAQAVLGGITVLTGLSPQTVAAHFLVSQVLVAASAWLLLTGPPSGPGEPPDDTVSPYGVGESATVAAPPTRREIRVLATLVAAATAAVLVMGTVVTGSGPHSGDTRPTGRFPLDPQLVSWLHADLVLVLLGLVVATVVAVRVTDQVAVLRRRAGVLLVVTLAQGLLGYVQYFTGLPEAVVVAHMLGAALLVIAVTALSVSVFRAQPAVGRL